MRHYRCANKSTFTALNAFLVERLLHKSVKAVSLVFMTFFQKRPLVLAALAAGATLPWSAAYASGPVLEPVAAVPEMNAASMELAGQIVAIGYPEEDREALFFGTMDQMVGQMRSAIAPTLPNDDPGAVAILDDWIAEYTEESKKVLRRHIPAIMSGMVEAYATIFTEEELEDILAFVRTRSGQRYFALSPAIVGSKSFADANQRYMDESVAMIGPAQRELKSRLDDYMTEKKARNTVPDT